MDGWNDYVDTKLKTKMLNQLIRHSNNFISFLSNEYLHSKLYWSKKHFALKLMNMNICDLYSGGDNFT